MIFLFQIECWRVIYYFCICVCATNLIGLAHHHKPQQQSILLHGSQMPQTARSPFCSYQLKVIFFMMHSEPDMPCSSVLMPFSTAEASSSGLNLGMKSLAPALDTML